MIILVDDERKFMEIFQHTKLNVVGVVVVRYVTVNVKTLQMFEFFTQIYENSSFIGFCFHRLLLMK